MAPRPLFSIDLADLPVVEAEFLIIGTGIAGLFAAFRAKEYGAVLVVTKERAEDSNTEKAQGGIAAAVEEDDSPFLHLEDTLEAGAGICDPEAVRILVSDGPTLVMQLVELGVNFDREGSQWALGREGAHRKRRILHATDATGEEIARALIRECRGSENITLREGCFLVDLLRDPDTGVCCGALLLDSRSGEPFVCSAPVVIVATGGAGQLYQNTTNPTVATGDGMAAAYRAGAELMDLEFFQFHPTALALGGAPRFLISEAVRGEGAFLRNGRGERFMPKYHEMAELAPRDVVTRAIVQEMEKSGDESVYLDISHLNRERFREKFPNIWRTCRLYGLDLEEGYIPVAPAAHYIMGGIRTDYQGKTIIPGLYACGEVACNGVHGANRLASNSLLDGLVFGARAVADARRYLELMEKKPRFPRRLAGMRPVCWRPSGADWDEVAAQVRRLMWEKAGIVRNEEWLLEALNELGMLWRAASDSFELNRSSVEAANILTLARLMVSAALLRRESRGSHFRSDYPYPDDRLWLRHIVFQI
ncbi:MAG: L-aspartate oxidase [Thermacetogeniaceae bacterium]